MLNVCFCFQSKKRDVPTRDEEDGDSILSSDAGSAKKKRYSLLY